MPDANLEYFPHIVDLIFRHIPAWDLHIASQVCSSWRSRAEAAYVRHLSAKPDGRVWELSIPADFFFSHELQYYLPFPAPRPRPRPRRTCPRLWRDDEPYTDHLRPLAPELLRHVQVLDVYFYDLEVAEEEKTYALFLDRFPNLSVMRAQARCNFPIRGRGRTQVFFAIWEECLDTRLCTSDAETVVLNFWGRTYNDVLDEGNPIQAFVSEQILLEGCVEVVFVLDKDMAEGGGAGGAGGAGGIAGGGGWCHADPG